MKKEDYFAFMRYRNGKITREGLVFELALIQKEQKEKK